MIGTVNIEFSNRFDDPSPRSPIERGPLKLPEGCSVDGGLIAFGENDMYLHCIVGATGDYYGVFKSSDERHLYQELLRLNRGDGP